MILPGRTKAQGSSQTDTSQLRFPIRESAYPFSTSGQGSPLYLKPPSNIGQDIEYDPGTGRYNFSEKVGELNYRPSASMSIQEYQRYEAEKSKSDYWHEKSMEESGGGPSFMKNLRLNNQAIDKVFGTDVISITPQGSAELYFGYSISRYDNPLLPVRNQKNGSFVFKEKIQMNVTGSIGDKMEVGLNYNTEATFDFENKTKLEYTGKEDEIIKKIEAGDVSLTLPGTLITGSQSLFGLKTELQFGRMTVTSVISQQRGESSSINVQGGAQVTEYEIDVSNYDANRHFFLSHFFRDNYNEWLKNLPYIESQVQIQQIEVWVVNKQNNFEETRDIVAFMDLGEGYGPDGEPNFYGPVDEVNPGKGLNNPSDNGLNSIYSRFLSRLGSQRLSSVGSAVNSEFDDAFVDGTDYLTVENARPLSDREYTVNSELGYISLNSPLRNDEILAVAYTYTYRGETFVVGDLTSFNSAPKVLTVKLLKGRTQSPKYSNWDLMMKNVYAIGAFQVSPEGFILNLLYRNDRTGVPVNYLPEDDPNTISESAIRTPLLKIMGLDNLDSRNEPNPDGRFDYIEGVTINSRNGRIYFPLLEPFGSGLRDSIVGDASGPLAIARNRTADKYVFEALYDSTKTKAEQVAERNKFYLQGEYKSSSSSEIQLNAMNVPRGSVTVTAGGVPLQEGSDYTVDYTLGRVRIINQGLLESGTPIRISLESNSLFNIQTKTLLGTHLDYRFSENFNVGATIMKLTERPLTQKVNMGDEPISNMIWGLNTSYRTQSQLLTTIVDKLPFLETKEPSSIAIDGEFAHLIPGQSKAIGKEPVAYIDDFEAAQTKIEMKTFSNWYLSSVPRDTRYFMNGNADSILSGYGRARLAWYVIDPLFYDDGGLNPNTTAIKADLSSHYARQIEEREIFPEKSNQIPGQNYLSILNLAYYPDERGPYNFDPNLTDSAKLQNPVNRWGGIMREIINSDFETSNIEFIEFWMLDPFIENPDHEGGDLYIQLGEISEDILRDGEKSYEGGLPFDESENMLVKNTAWGIVPSRAAYTNTFAIGGRAQQDVGLDGLSNENEASFFATYIDQLQSNGVIASLIEEDVANDDFEYYLNDDHTDRGNGIFERYKRFNGLERNSPPENSDSENTNANKNSPDIEDINRDNTLNTEETYFQYHVRLRPSDLHQVGENYIVGTAGKEIAGHEQPSRWIQFRIPLSDWEDKYGDIEDFKSMRFMRLLMSGFEEEVVVRFATLDLIRSEWRRYNFDIAEAAPIIDQGGRTTFEVSAVNIEEHASKEPIAYVLPPDVDRVIDPSNQQIALLNEQSILLKVEDLEDADARAVFKNTQLDIRKYKELEMYIHAEALPGREGELKDNDLSAFIRIGSDYKNNYYEIEVPLILTDHGEKSASSVWNEANMISMVLDQLVDLKKLRNEMAEEDPMNNSINTVFARRVGTKTIKVKGTPNLGNIRQIMIGIRNPGDATSIIRNDGLPKSAEVWFNELRLKNFDNKGGWAANGRVQLQLADFGVVNVAGSKSTPGFGSIEETVEQRQMEEINQFDISSNLELGKFFAEKANISIPLYVGASKTIINPEYYPRDPDIKFREILEEAETREEMKEIKKLAQDVTARSSINITNMRWNKKVQKIDIISPANLTLSAGYTQTRARDYSTLYDNFWRYNAGLNYVFNTRPKDIQPLRKSKGLRKPAYRIIRDFNFTPYPSRFTFGNVFDRTYQEMQLRNVSDEVELIIEPTVNKDFRWDRKYDLKWDLTRSLKLDYSATNSARIDEINGQYDLFKDENTEWKQAVWSSIQDGGRNMNFTQKFDVSYNIPINKIPIFNWVTMNTSYGGTYNWVRGEVIPGKELGNTLKNSNSAKVNANINFRSLYNKVGYLKKIDAKYGSTSRNKPAENQRFKEVRFEKRTFLNKETPKNIIHKLKTEDVSVNVYTADGEEIEVSMTVVNPNKITITAGDDYTGVNVVVIGKLPKGENPLVLVTDNVVRLLTGFKSANASWTLNRGTLMPGYLPETDYFGLSTSGDYYGQPGWPFAFGAQNPDIVYDFIGDSLVTRVTTFSRPAEFTRNEQVTLRTTYEPFRGLRVDLNATRSYTEYEEQLFFYDEEGDRSNFGNYFVDNKYKGGNFSISTITLRTAFEKPTSDNNYYSQAFEDLKAFRKVISSRRYSLMRDENPDYIPSAYDGSSEGYYDGYGPTSQEVLVPAFLAAYTGRDPNKVTFNDFFWAMLPNWRVTFDGLSKLDLVQKVVKTLTLTHSYKSTYTVGSFGTNVNYFDESPENLFSATSNSDIRTYVRDNQNNFIPQFQFSSVSIREQMTPLIGMDMTWHNSLLTRFEYGKSRMIGLSLNNNQVNETRDRDFTVGAGYRFKQVPITINQKQIESDLNLRFDLTVRNNFTIIRFLTEQPEEESDNRITTGGRRFDMSITADYVFSQNVNIQFFFERTVNTPFTTLNYPNSETNIGFSLRLSL
jgi:cell surface protein SprA